MQRSQLRKLSSNADAIPSVRPLRSRVESGETSSMTWRSLYESSLKDNHVGRRVPNDRWHHRWSCSSKCPLPAHRFLRVRERHRFGQRNQHFFAPSVPGSDQGSLECDWTPRRDRCNGKHRSDRRSRVSGSHGSGRRCRTPRCPWCGGRTWRTRHTRFAMVDRKWRANGDWTERRPLPRHLDRQRV